VEIGDEVWHLRLTRIWSPYTVKDIKAIESVQRRFTKRLPGLNNLKQVHLSTICIA